MKNTTMSDDSHNQSISPNRSVKLIQSSYKIPKKFNPSISDDFYTRKKEQVKLKNTSAKKIQKFFRRLLSQKKLALLKNLQKKSRKPLITQFQTLSQIFKSKFSKHWQTLKKPTNTKKSFTFDLSNLNIKPELLDKIKGDDKGMISYLFDGLGNETQTFVKDMNESHTFFKVFQETPAEKSFQVKEFDNFDEMNFSRFDFMEIELPEFIGKDFNCSLWKKEKIEERVRVLSNKAWEMNEVLLKEMNIREDLIDEKAMLQSVIKKILNIKKFHK